MRPTNHTFVALANIPTVLWENTRVAADAVTAHHGDKLLILKSAVCNRVLPRSIYNTQGVI